MQAFANLCMVQSGVQGLTVEPRAVEPRLSSNIYRVKTARPDGPQMTKPFPHYPTLEIKTCMASLRRALSPSLS